MKDKLVVKEISKQIGAKKILRQVSFEVETGDLVVITGPNGAGKTTLMRVLAGLLPKNSGQISWNDSHVLEQGIIGYLSHQPMLYEALSVYENLRFFGRMCGLDSATWLEEQLKLVGLWHYRYEPAAILSRGMKQRLALARTLISRPRLILYDEPFTSLDQSGQNLLKGILARYRDQAIQLVITHEPQFLEGLNYKELRLKSGQVEQGGSTDA